MKAKLSGLCRGDGIVYMRMDLSETPISEPIEVRAARNDGTELPANWYKLDDGDGHSRIAVTVPLLSGDSFSVSVEKQDEPADGKDAITIAANRAKWQSRLTYRFDKETATQLRDIDARRLDEGIHVMFDYALPDGESTVVRARITMPHHDDSAVHVTAQDAEGRALDVRPIVMGGFTQQPEPPHSLPTRVQDVSFSIPASLEAFTLIACDENHPRLRGFRSFRGQDLGVLLERGSRFWQDASTDPRYDELFRARRASAEALERQREASLASGRMFSIVVPLDNAASNLLGETLNSVLAQSYPNWELVLVSASPDDGLLVESACGAASRDERIRIVAGSRDANLAAAACAGDFVCLLGQSDVLEPDALFRYASTLDAHPDTDLLYCDEDRITEDGSKYYRPFFKSDFDPELLRCSNYMRHFLCMRKSSLDESGLPLPLFGEAAAYNLALIASEHARRVSHVPAVLYHWREEDRLAASGNLNGSATIGSAADAPKADAQTPAVEAHLKRLGIPACVEPGPTPFSRHVRYPVQGDPLVSIVIPNKDGVSLLDTCIQSIIDKTSYQNFEVVIVENNSVEPETEEYYSTLASLDDRIRVERWEGAFNFSKIVNFGTAQAKGDFLLLLNNDTEVLAPTWLESMLGICQLEGVGAVGAHLRYPDGTTQHAGVILPNTQDSALHELICSAKSNLGYFGRGGMTHGCIAVTAACMMTSRAAFERVGGFREELSVAFNDVDYCLKLHDAGLRVVFEPAAELIHHESATRGLDVADQAKHERMLREAAILKRTWAAVYSAGDPFYNPNLTDLYHLAWH